MEIQHFIDIVLLLILGTFFQEINCIRFSKETNIVDILDLNTLVNTWNTLLEKNERIIIGCFESNTNYEYDNFVRAINNIENLETTEGLQTSKNYAITNDEELLNVFFQKTPFNQVYVEAPSIIVLKRDSINGLLHYEYSMDQSYSVPSIQHFIIESASEIMSDMDNVHLINNNYYYINSDNKASLYSIEKPFIYVNLNIINNKYTSDVFKVFKQYKNQFNIVYSNQSNGLLSPFESLRFSPLSIIKNTKKKGLERTYDSSLYSDSYVTTLYHFSDNMTELSHKNNLSYPFLTEFIQKFNNNTLIPEKPKVHFENKVNDKIIEFKFQDYVMELNNKNYIDITGDVFKDVYVLIYYPWSEDYEKIKPIWNELAKNLYNERNNIILASYNVLDNEVLNTEFKNRNDYPEIVLYKSQFDDVENNKKKIIMYRREAGVSYESLASWISSTTIFDVKIPFSIEHLKSRIENQGYIGTNMEYIFNRDKYMDYINSEHLAPKLDNEDLLEMRITSSYYLYQSKTVEIHSQPTYAEPKDPPPIPDPIPKAPENFFYKTFIFDDEAVLSIGIKIPYAEYPPKYVGAKEIKERIIRDEIRSEQRKKEQKLASLNSKALALENANGLSSDSKKASFNDVKKKSSKEIAREKALDTMNIGKDQKKQPLNTINVNGVKKAKLNEALGSTGTKNAKLDEALGGTGAKKAKLNEALNQDTTQSTKQINLPKDPKKASLEEILGNNNLRKRNFNDNNNNNLESSTSLNENHTDKTYNYSTIQLSNN